MNSLNEEAERLEQEKPEEAEMIRHKAQQVTEVWQELKLMVCFTAVPF